MKKKIEKSFNLVTGIKRLGDDDMIFIIETAKEDTKKEPKKNDSNKSSKPGKVSGE